MWDARMDERDAELRDHKRIIALLLEQMGGKPDRT